MGRWIAGKGSISQYRERLDKTLASQDLANEEALKILVKNQILRSSQSGTEEYIDSIVETRTRQATNFLGMLRSASVDDDEVTKSNQMRHSGWKLKQDTEELRVMYQEGLEGSPFHTLLAEGYVDGPLDVCLCISCESSLYKKWWPQVTVPTFKIISSQCLKTIRTGEQISLIRMKVSWPLSAREALVHYFAFEYFQGDLIVVLLNSISDLESINMSTHGFNRDGIPAAQDVVRIDVVGGFALQKVTGDRSFFRTIVNLDIKLDFVPPAFINFVSRQLVGSGFKLYKKEVASVSKGDEDFGSALKDPLYNQIREALYSDGISRDALTQENLKNDTRILTEEEHQMETTVSEVRSMDEKMGPENLKSNTHNLATQHSVRLMEAEGSTSDVKISFGDHASRSATEDAVEITNMGDEGIDIDGKISSGDHKSHSTIEDLVAIEAIGGKEITMDEKICTDDHASHLETEDAIFINQKEISEIDDIAESKKQVEEESRGLYSSPISKITERSNTNNANKVVISFKVEKAIETLEKVISIFREHGYTAEAKLSGFTNENEKLLNIEKEATKDSNLLEDGQIQPNGMICAETSNNEPMESSHVPCNSSGCCSARCKVSNREGNHNKVAPALPDDCVPDMIETQQTAFGSPQYTASETSVLEKTSVDDKLMMINANSNGRNRLAKRKRRILKFCCLNFIAGKLMA